MTRPLQITGAAPGHCQDRHPHHGPLALLPPVLASAAPITNAGLTTFVDQCHADNPDFLFLSFRSQLGSHASSCLLHSGAGTCRAHHQVSFHSGAHHCTPSHAIAAHHRALFSLDHIPSLLRPGTCLVPFTHDTAACLEEGPLRSLTISSESVYAVSAQGSWTLCGSSHEEDQKPPECHGNRQRLTAFVCRVVTAPS